MIDEHTLTLITRLLEECLEHDYSSEELQSKARDILRLLDGAESHESLENGVISDQ